MAHIAKYKAPSVGHMLAHYRRDRSSLERDNIDPERIKNDLVVGHYTNKDGKLVVGRVEPREGEPNWGTVESRIERVNEAFGVDLEAALDDDDNEYEFDTIGGLIAHQIGHVPRRGEFHTIAGLNFVVLHTRGGAVRWFKVSPAADGAEGA